MNGDREKLRSGLKRVPVRDPGGVFVAWVCPGDVRALFMESMLRLFISDMAKGNRPRQLLRPGSGYRCAISGPDVATTRNGIIREFLTHYSAQWLLLVDSDMVFEADALDKLLESADRKERPVVGGLCFGGGKGAIFPTMYRLVDPKENDGEFKSYVTDWEDGDVVRVDATGAAFLLIHRDVLKRMWQTFPEPAPWFAWSVYKEIPFSEDWTFCLKLIRLEIPLYVNTAVKVGHEKTLVMDEAMWRGDTGLRSIGLDGKDEDPTVTLTRSIGA